MDGGRTDRSEMAASLARWANDPAQADLMAATPVRGEIGLLVVPETQAWDSLLSHEGGFETYREAMWGAYRGLMGAGLQPDWVHVDDIEGCATLYAPYPIMWPEAVARRLAAWVEAGGTLICESCPGYFGDRGHVGTRQPNHGLDALFGAREVHVEFMPDIAHRDAFTLGDLTLPCGGFRQVYEATDGVVLGAFADGAAVVEAAAGRGRTLLVGTHVSAAHFRGLEAGGAGAEGWWERVRDWAGLTPHVTAGEGLIARLHEGPAGRHVWVVNPTREPRPARLALRDGAARLVPLWGEAGGLDFTVPPRDAVIARIET
jgi:beta-galactosidase